MSAKIGCCRIKHKTARDRPINGEMRGDYTKLDVSMLSDNEQGLLKNPGSVDTNSARYFHQEYEAEKLNRGAGYLHLPNKEPIR
jgi:hypothetical protein